MTMTDVKKKRQRKPIGGSSLRKNRPPGLTPYWHPEVERVVRHEKDRVLREEMCGSYLGEAAKAWQDGSIEGWLGHYQKWLLETGDVDELVSHVRGDLAALFLPQIIDAIGRHRARAKNAVGRREWDAAVRTLGVIGSALMALPGEVPGFPRWFRECFKLEFEATTKDVKDTKKEYDALPRVRRREVSFEDYLSNAMKVKRLAPGTVRELTLAVLAYRWGVFPGGVENWLKPAKAPGHVRKGDATIKVIDLGDEEWIIDPNKDMPVARRGRPPKGRSED